MHTFEISCRIPINAYCYLHDNLPSLKRVSQYVERTNYYSAKGITQIELHTHEYILEGRKLQAHYLILRCNPSIIMGESSVFLLDMEKYTPAEIIERIQKRLYEINELRYVKMHEYPFSLFQTSRADIAEDIQSAFPELVVWLCNMSFPYNYCNMERKKIKKDNSVLYFETCCFANKSREILIYHKGADILNNNRPVSTEEKARADKTVRAEIHIKKQCIYNMRLSTKRSLRPFLEHDFNHKYLEKELKSIFGLCRYVSRSRAEIIISQSRYSAYEKAVMLQIMELIPQFEGLYELEKAIADESAYSPHQFGSLRTFKERWLKKFRQLGIQPIAIPDIYGIDELPSAYELVINN